MAVIYITKDNFDAVVLNGEKPVLLDFYADWCGPCRNLAPVFAEVAAERDDVVFAKVNIDAERDLARTFKVRSVPTLVLMDKGETICYAIGSKNKGQLLAMLDRGAKGAEEKKGFWVRIKEKLFK